MARIDANQAERQAFKTALQPLLSADGRKFDVAEWHVFFEALRDVPIALVQQAALAMARERRRFPFRPADIRAAAEQQRQALIARHPFERCAECRDSGGFLEVTDAGGVKRMKPCVCRADYIARLERLGVPPRPLLQLTAAEEETV